MFAALAAFETRVQIRQSGFRIGLLLVAGAPLVALLVERGRYAPACYGYAYLASVALRLGLGVAEQQQSGFALLMSNFASAPRRMAAALTGLLMRELLVLVPAFVLAVLVWGDLRTGAWYALEFSLITCLLLPLATAIELWTGMRAPGAVAMLAAFLLLFVGMRFSDPITALAYVGITQAAGNFAALGRLAATGAAGVLLTLALCWSWALARREVRA